MKSKLNPLQKRMAEDMILYYHNAKRFRDMDEPEHEAPFLEKYETERARLSQSLKYPVSVRGDNSPCYFVVSDITRRAVYIEGDK